MESEGSLPWMEPNVNKFNPLYNFTQYFFNMYFNITLPSMVSDFLPSVL